MEPANFQTEALPTLPYAVSGASGRLGPLVVEALLDKLELQAADRERLEYRALVAACNQRQGERIQLSEARCLALSRPASTLQLGAFMRDFRTSFRSGEVIQARGERSGSKVVAVIDDRWANEA